MKDEALKCPNPEECVLCVQDGHVHCQTHDLPLTIDNETQDQKSFDEMERIPMRHVCYMAFTSPRGPGFVIIDAEQ